MKLKVDYDKEEWRDIPCFPEYQASNCGRIRSKTRIINTEKCTRLHRGKIISPSIQNSGYYSISLRANNKILHGLVHRLVAETFLGPIPEGKEVDHINEDKLDNRIVNLRYLTRFDNASRSTLGFFRKESNSMEHNPRTKIVVGYGTDGVAVKYPCAKYLSKIYGINYSTLRKWLQRGGITINGIKFSYAN